MPAAKPVRSERPIKFDDAMRRAMRVPATADRQKGKAKSPAEETPINPNA